MNVTPIKTRVLIAENSNTAKSESGIILDSAKSVRDHATATVLAIGPDVTDVTVGDKILVDWAKGSVVKIGDAQRVVIDQEHIIAVFEQ